MVDRHASDVMTTPVLTLDGSAPITEAASAMSEAGINSLLVVEEGCQPMGIFTSTDVLEAVAADVNLAATPIEERVTQPVETIDPDETVAAAAERMRAGGFSHLPVTDVDGDALGILTQTDLADVVADSAGVVSEP